MKKSIVAVLVVAFAVFGANAKTLIVYFSPANSDTVDAVSSATPRADGVSPVEYVANLINDEVKADAAKIVPLPSYPLEYSATADKAKAEQTKNERPAFTLSPNINIEEYDTVFVGYPIWWYTLPMVMQTFFDKYDFSGKTVIPFNTHLGSRDGGTYRTIKKLESKAKVLDGLAVNANRAQNSKADVRKWLKGLGY